MYGIPDGETFEFFRGCSLYQLCVGRYQVILQFDEDVEISVEGRVGIRHSGGEERVVEDLRELSVHLAAVLDTHVIDVVVHDRQSFSLRWENGLSLRMIDGPEPYESFLIHHGDRQIIV